MANTLDLTAKQIVTDSIKSGTTYYSTSTFRIPNIGSIYLEFNTTESWETDISIGYPATKGNYFISDKFNGYGLYSNFKGECFIFVKYQDGLRDVIRSSSLYPTSNRVGFRINTKSISAYALKNKTITEDKYELPSPPEADLANKDLYLTVSGLNNVNGGIYNLFIDPSTWNFYSGINQEDGPIISLIGKSYIPSNPNKHVKQY